MEEQHPDDDWWKPWRWSRGVWIAGFAIWLPLYLMSFIIASSWVRDATGMPERERRRAIVRAAYARIIVVVEFFSPPRYATLSMPRYWAVPVDDTADAPADALKPDIAR